MSDAPYQQPYHENKALSPGIGQSFHSPARQFLKSKEGSF